MNRIRHDADFVDQQERRMTELLRQRAALDRDDLEYLAERAAKLKDERMQRCIAELIGWGDDERAEIETFIAIALHIMRRTNVSKLRDAARVVELRYYAREAA